MHRLPFNPVPLLALFMTKESAGSLVGDLEERFNRTLETHGRLKAIIEFLWALLISVPPIVKGAFMPMQSQSPLPSGALPSLQEISVRYQSVRILNFPHQWNQFTLVGIEGGSALLNKWSNHQRFTVPIPNIVAVRSDSERNELDWTLTCQVRLESDGTACGTYWTV